MKFNPTACTLILALLSAVASAQAAPAPNTRTARTEQMLQRDEGRVDARQDGQSEPTPALRHNDTARKS